MGTNYYYCTLKNGRVVHIGKCSCGWRFLFQASPELQKFEDLETLFNEGVVKDEYGKKISYKRMLKIIEPEKGDRSHFGVDYCERRGMFDFCTVDFC